MTMQPKYGQRRRLDVTAISEMMSFAAKNREAPLIFQNIKISQQNKTAILCG
jgi:hypothetical protein